MGLEFPEAGKAAERDDVEAGLRLLLKQGLDGGILKRCHCCYSLAGPGENQSFFVCRVMRPAHSLEKTDATLITHQLFK